MILVVMDLAGAVVDACARVVAVLRRAAWVAVGWVVVAAALDGCAHVILPGPPWGTEPFPRYEPSALPVVPDDVPPAVGLKEGQPAPFAGVLFADEEIEEIQTAADQRDVLVDALDLCYDGREDDRGGAEVVFSAREEQIRLGRIAAVRAFGAGSGIGAFVGGIVGLIVGVNVPR